MRFAALSAIFVTVVTAASVHAGEWVDLGRWQAYYLGTKVVADMERDGREIRGVAQVYSPFGKKDTYHFNGRVQNGILRAAHHSGHRFKGRLTSPEEVVGVLTTRNGHKLRVRAVRQ